MKAIEIVRLFNPGLPSPWRQSVAAVGKLATVVSFKADPLRVVKGAYDTRLTRWFHGAPRSRAIYWTYYHEPEDQIANGDFTAGQFRAAWEHINKLANAAHNPDLKSTVILMCWTLNETSGRNYRDYVSIGTADVVAWDCYNHDWKYGGYVSPERLLQRAVDASTAVGSGWGVAELGSRVAVGDNGTGRAEWLQAVGAYAEAAHAGFVTYFDSYHGGDFALDDVASRKALERLAG